jgi:hypothetical protein
MCKEVFININEGFIKWFGPNTSGSEPTLDNKEEALGRVVKCLTQVARVRGEEWSFRFSHQPKL